MAQFIGFRFSAGGSGFGPPWPPARSLRLGECNIADNYCLLYEIPIMSYLPDSFKDRSGPGVSGSWGDRSWNLVWNFKCLGPSGGPPCPPILVGTVADPTLAQDQSFFFRFDWTPAARGGARMKLRWFRQDNRINRIFFSSTLSCWSSWSCQKIYRPFDTKAHDGRHTLFDVRCWTFDLPAMPWSRCEANLTIWLINKWLRQLNARCMAGGCSKFISFFFDLTGRFFGPATGLNTDTWNPVFYNMLSEKTR
jgi:hypothetical protein